MYIKLRLTDNNIIDAAVKDIKVTQSKWNGTGTITVRNADMLWLGNIHFWSPEITFQTDCVCTVETRSTLNEDDEPWALFWDRIRAWCYDDDHDIENRLIKFGGY